MGRGNPEGSNANDRGDCRKEEMSDSDLELKPKGPYIHKDWKWGFQPKLIVLCVPNIQLQVCNFYTKKIMVHHRLQRKAATMKMLKLMI